MKTLYPLDPIALSFFESAPYRVQLSMDVSCTPQRVMASLRDNQEWAKWAKPIRRADWTSEKPYTAGATRVVRLLGGIRLREVFFHWDEDQRVAFYISHASASVIRRFAEDYRLSKLGSGRVRIAWMAAYEPAHAAWVLGPLIGFTLRKLVKQWLRDYKSLLESS